MTLIVGMYYENKKGALIASDSRMTKECHYNLIRKIFGVENIIIAVAGIVCINKQLVKNIESILGDEEDIEKVLEKAQIKIYEDYMLGENPRLCEHEMSQGLCGFYTDHPEIFRFFSQLTEPVENFSAVGQEDDDTENFLKKFYREDITKEKAMELAVYSIIEASKNNVSVDDNPQIAIIGEGGCKILNYEENGNFTIQKPEILQIKKKINEISNYNEIAFDILLHGKKDVKDKLTSILKEYEK